MENRRIHKNIIEEGRIGNKKLRKKKKGRR
jgi:hypothetical protein